MTDYYVQFTSLPREMCSDPKPNELQLFLQRYNIRHIKARVKQPQSNGKVERAGQTLQRLWKHFQYWDATVEYYNFKCSS